MNNKLQVKDFMVVGIFTSIYLVVVFMTMMLGYIPVVIPFLGGIMAMFGGIPFILFLSKVEKFGMIFLFGILLGFVFFLMGSGILILIFGMLFGMLSDLVMKTGGYKDLKKAMLSYAIFSLWSMGFSIRMYIDRTNYFADQAKSYGKEYVDELMSLTPIWTFPVMTIITFVLGIIGAKLGLSIFKKHFKRVGI